MKRPLHTHGVVCLSALDLRTRPGHAAELSSQLLLGEVVELLGGSQRGWRRVRNLADGYAGWVRDWGLVATSRARARNWQRKAAAWVSDPIVWLRALPQGGISVGPLTFGARVIPGRATRGRRSVELPDGRIGWLGAGALRTGAASRPTVAERIYSLLGAPYLWGGRTPAGYDCSAFIQQVLREQGLVLPRDAHEQYLACRVLRPSEHPRLGDLAFFRAKGERVSHVGLWLAEGCFAHARGTVRISSLDLDNPLCDKPLLPQFIGWFRPRSRPRH